MARVFNGTTDKGAIAVDLSPFLTVSFSFWLWWDSYVSNDDFCLSYSTNYNINAFYVDPNRAADANVEFGFTGGGGWLDKFPRPPAAKWHHWALIMDRSRLRNVAYIDGVLQPLTTILHSTTGGTFGNANVNVMCGNGSTFFGAGRMAELAIWGGPVLTATDVTRLYRGTDARLVRSGGLLTYTKMNAGQSPELDYSGRGKSASLTGTTYVPWSPPRPPTARPFYRSSFTAIKTVAGLTRASVKTVDGLAVASVKTWGGVA